MNETSLPTLAWGAATDAGRVRTENEDTFVAEPLVFVVADGMGGHQAGEVASAIATTTLRDRLSAGAASVDVAVAAVVEANAAIFQGAHTNVDQRGMGTTVTAMVVVPHSDAGPRLAVLNVGDSRTYVLRGGRLRRVTIDHSYVQELVSTGHISEIEARNHPRRNIVTRALGIEPSVRVDTWVLPFVRGDRYVLCSDGLVDEVDDDAIAEVLAVHASPQAAAEALVEVALRNGGRDNVTVVVVDSLEGDEPPSAEADLAIDLSWDEEEAAERLVDAEPAAATSGDTAPLPVIAGARTRRLSPGVFLFGIALVAIVAATVTLLAVVGGDSDTPAPTTTEQVTTTEATTTTTEPTSTTIDAPLFPAAATTTTKP